MIKVSKYNIPLLEKFLKKENYIIQVDVPVIGLDGSIIGWNDVEIRIIQGKKELVVTDGMFLKKEYVPKEERTRLKIYKPPKHRIADYIQRGYRTYLLQDFSEPITEVIEHLNEIECEFVIDEPLNILCIRD